MAEVAYASESHPPIWQPCVRHPVLRMHAANSELTSHFRRRCRCSGDWDHSDQPPEWKTPTRRPTVTSSRRRADAPQQDAVGSLFSSLTRRRLADEPSPRIGPQFSTCLHVPISRRGSLHGAPRKQPVRDCIASPSTYVRDTHPLLNDGKHRLWRLRGDQRRSPSAPRHPPTARAGEESDSLESSLQKRKQVRSRKRTGSRPCLLSRCPSLRKNSPHKNKLLHRQVLRVFSPSRP